MIPAFHCTSCVFSFFNSLKLIIYNLSMFSCLNTHVHYLYCVITLIDRNMYYGNVNGIIIYFLVKSILK